jgi:hypothetical protein
MNNNNLEKIRKVINYNENKLIIIILKIINIKGNTLIY